MALITMKVNGREVKAEKREPILRAIRDAGFDVPTLCHLDGLEPYGVCRLCTVEIRRGKRSKLVTSCNFPAAQDLEVFSQTDEVLAHRALMAELLLARCPGVKRVQEIAASLGVTHTRFRTDEPGDCVLCGLCVRVCDEIVGASALGFQGRGSTRTVGTPFHVHPDACIACGACTYVCPTRAMQMEAVTKARWHRELATGDRLCRYARMGLISHKVCPNNFDCATCEVDQRLFDEFGTHPILVLAPGRARRPKQVGHFAVREDRLYFFGHTWIGQAQRKARIGIDDFAQRLIGSVVQATPLVAPGDRVERGDPACEIASARHRTTMRFPMSGRVVRTNPFLEQEPSVLNEDCYNRGWLFVIEPQDYYGEARRLVDAERVNKWIQAESDRLFGALSELGGASALSDGGELLPDFSSELSPQGWERVADMFFSGVDVDPVL